MRCLLHDTERNQANDWTYSTCQMDKFILIPSFHFTLCNAIVVLSYQLMVVGIFYIYFPKNVPPFLSSLYRYGKANDKPDPKNQRKFLHVPKRWFLHFYINAVILSSIVAWMVWVVYFQAGHCPAAASVLFFWLSSPDSRHATVAAESVTIATALVFSQTVKRLYECLYVNIFSDGRMSIFHYIYGLGFYLMVCLSLLIEAPGFIEPCRASSCTLELWSSRWLTLNHVVGASISLFGLHLEWQSSKILASLRKNNKGDVVTHQHKVPFGGWFDWVSCPHFLGEVIFYLGVNIVFGGNNTTFHAIFLSVLVNQVLTANMSHEWYKNNFPDYPKNRKALFPFIY